MTNAELIGALRWCGGEHQGWCVDETYKCPLWSKDRRDKDALGDYCKEELMTNAADALEAADKRIAELMPKEGEWIEDDTTYCGADRANYKCSLCGKIGGTWKRGLTQDELPNYCPNCGAKMKKGEQE